VVGRKFTQGTDSCAEASSDLLRALESDCGAVYARILESEPHRLHTVVVTILELTSAHSFIPITPSPSFFSCWM